MIHKMFSIYDAKAKAYLPPFILPEVGMATRAFGDAVNSTDHQFNKHPSDYFLHQIATFDDAVGRIVQLDRHELVCSGTQVKNHELENRVHNIGSGAPRLNGQEPDFVDTDLEI